jgi:hypothetical protein
VNLDELNFNDGSEDQKNQDTGSKEILEEVSGHTNDNEDVNTYVTIIEWRFTP